MEENRVNLARHVVSHGKFFYLLDGECLVYFFQRFL